MEDHSMVDRHTVDHSMDNLEWEDPCPAIPTQHGVDHRPTLSNLRHRGVLLQLPVILARLSQAKTPWQQHGQLTTSQCTASSSLACLNSSHSHSSNSRILSNLPRNSPDNSNNRLEVVHSKESLILLPL